MNRLVAQQLKEINKTLDELKEAVALQKERAAAAEKARQDMQLKFWSQSKEMHVLKQSIEALPELQRENEQFRAVRADFEKRLRDIIACTRALAAEFRS